MNKIFFLLIAVATLYTTVQQLQFKAESSESPAPMTHLSQSVVESAQSAVTLSIGLIGIMAFFLGLMKVAEKGGLLSALNSLLSPFLIKLFPQIPKDHPAMSAIIMNISSNVFGLANAATPFGIKAMHELQNLNKEKDTASDAMILFLALNTSSVTLIPTGVIALRASAGSTDAAGIVATTLIATTFSTFVAILTAKLLQRNKHPSAKMNLNFKHYLFLLGTAVIIPLVILTGAKISMFFIPFLILAILTYGIFNKVPIYEAMVEGAKEGFDIAVKIIPFLVTILVAIGMFKASGVLSLFVNFISQFTLKLGLPGEAIPMALLRPLSGSGAYGVMASIINDPSIGPDSYTGYLVSTLQGSTETTFYVLAVYFGAVQIKKLRSALPIALIADLAGIIGAVVACQLLYGHLMN